eukprot:scaffold63187_cov18-Tisochrysis_lutea.AAC.2
MHTHAAGFAAATTSQLPSSLRASASDDQQQQQQQRGASPNFHRRSSIWSQIASRMRMGSGNERSSCGSNTSNTQL